MKIQPASRLRGRLSVPGDKSISHRAAIIGALAAGTTTIENYSTSRDCASTLSCLQSLGVALQRHGNVVQIHGKGLRGLRAATAPLDCGNSGSTMRMLAGVLSGQDFDSVLIGDDSLSARPMRRVIEPLTQMGAQISASGDRPPLHITGSNSLQPINYELPVASAQVKSCVLLAGLITAGRTEVIESLGLTRDHTERMLRWFGVPLESGVRDDGAPTVAIEGPVSYNGREVSIPGDISSAAFLLGAAALLPGSSLRIDRVGLNPTRAQILTLLTELGLNIQASNTREDCNEPSGDILINGITDALVFSDRPRHRVAGSLIAQLIDELPLLAVMGSQLAGGLEIRDAAELRLKETDRLAATITNLRAMGVEVEEFDDGLAVSGPTRLKGARLQSFGDHRIAMAFTVGALLAEGESELDGADDVGVSFPEFFDLLSSVLEKTRTHVLSMMRPIVITGFMAAGKTTVAKALGRLLQCAVIDLDQLITDSENRSPQQLIEEDGEEAFRVIETSHLQAALSAGPSLVIALGGGAWTRQINQDLIAAHEGLTIWLDAPFDLCWQRISTDEVGRPLAPTREQARRLYHERRGFYEHATWRLEADGSAAAETLAAGIASKVLSNDAAEP